MLLALCEGNPPVTNEAINNQSGDVIESRDMDNATTLNDFIQSEALIHIETELYVREMSSTLVGGKNISPHNNCPITFQM